MKLFVPITKVDAVKRLVYGSLATEAVDKSGEIFDYESSKPFVEKWSGQIAKATDGKSVGNLRAMHGKVAAGKFTELVCDDAAKRVDVCAKVVDDTEWNKTVEGVYTGFSIGGAYVKKWKDGEHTRYTADPNEGSLVDLPCNPEAQFAMIKADGTEELRKFVQPAPQPEYEQVWLSKKDGKTFTKKEELKAHLATLEDPAAQLTAAVAELTTKVEKAEGAYGAAESSVGAQNQVIEIKDISELPAVIRALMADEDTAEVFRVALNHARANGMGEVEALDDAWGKVVEGSEKTIDGKYKITGELLPQKAAGVKTGPSQLVTDQLQAMQGRQAQRPGAVAKKEFTQAERDKAAEAGEAMSDGSYPIKTTKDLENAIKAFGRAKNKAAVKAHIKTRAKALGAEDKLPDSWKDGADKALVLGELRKGMYAISRLACLIEELEWFQQSQEMEAATEGDNSENPEKAKQVVAAACALLRSIVEEETNEMLSEQEMLDFGEVLEMAARVRGTAALAKLLGDKAPKLLQEVRKAHTKEEAGHVQAAHEHLASAGADCPNASDAEKAVKASLSKAGARHGAADQAHLDSAHEHLSKMGYCSGSTEKMAKAMSKEDQVHLDAAHDHVSKMGIGCGVSKSGARHSAADMEHLTKAHDHMAEAGASCPTHEAGVVESETKEAAATPQDLAKIIAEKDPKIDKLEKSVNEGTAAVKQLLERVVKLEAQEVPDPRRRSYRVVGKNDEEDMAKAEQELELAAKNDPTSVALALLKIAQSRPIKLSDIGK